MLGQKTYYPKKEQIFLGETMPLMNWDNKLDIGVDEMNEEHQGLLKCMNDLYDAWESKSPVANQKVLLDKLKDATIEHFSHEEAYMEKIGWEAVDVHRYIHKSLLETFTKHYQSFLDQRELTMEFFEFLRLWLAAHIQGIDKKYGDFEVKKSA
jgi:hemerythrin-like metal-binding protein